jgi:Na+/H+ antiporter NhaD/arsenite permease-like protein
MIIGIQSHISYLRFASHLLPVAAIGLIINFLVVAWVFRAELVTRQSRQGEPADNGVLNEAAIGGCVGEVHEDFAQTPAGDAVKALDGADDWLQRKSVVVTLVAILLFFAGFQIALVAIGAAAVLLIDPVDSQRIYQQIDWSLLLMFIGLFIVVRAFQVRVVATWGIEQWHWLLRHPIDLLSVASAALSNLVSNVPAVLLFEPVLRAIPPASRQNAWLALAMSSTFAGTLTVLGSVANLIVVENAKREGVTISFWEYCKVGIPVTILTLTLGIIWLRFANY